MILTNRKFRKYMDEICKALIAISTRLAKMEGADNPSLYDDRSASICVCKKCGAQTIPFIKKKKINQFGDYQNILVCANCESSRIVPIGEVSDERNTCNSDEG